MNTEHKYFFDTNCWIEGLNKFYFKTNFPNTRL